MDASANITTIMFTNEFKEVIKKIQATGLVEELRIGDITHLMNAQQDIREHIAKHYKKYIRKIFPDYYAMMICLVVDIDTIKGWEDFNDIFYPNLPYIGSGYHNTQTDYKCCCSHLVSSENTTLVSYKGYYLALGDTCILKTSIVSNFKEFKKLKKLQQEVNQLRRERLMYQIKHYISKSERERLRQEQELEQLKIQEYNDSHHICSCGIPCGKFLKCFQCKKQTEDKCECGKWKQKKYKKCFSCK
jgi:hypothetical protein